MWRSPLNAFNYDATRVMSLLLAATFSSGLTNDRALQVLERDHVNIPEEIRTCARQDPRALQDALKVRQISTNPNLLLVTVFYDGCVCFAQNCPYWVYRVRGNAASKILESVGVHVGVIPTNGAVPDIDEIAHESAMLKNETLYAYRNGTYIRSGAWRLRGRLSGGEDRKPVSAPVRFAPGMSSARLFGTIGYEWGDVYTFDAFAGQTVEISAMQAQRTTLVDLRRGNLSERLVTGRPVRLPATGTYTITVDPYTDNGDSDSTYAFTLVIH